jgi:predicted flap endonuclease-1-like 5' DNA nuclease
MSRRTLGIILIVAGLVLAVLSVSADMVGLGSQNDVFGLWQTAGLIAGVVLVVVGLYLFMAGQAEAAQPEVRTRPATPAEPAAPTKPAAPAAPAAPTQPAEPAEPDTLTQIEGIGPKIQSILYESGIITFQAVAETGSDTLTDILQTAGFQAPFDASSWPEQAALAAAGEWEGLKTLQDALKGGRRS